MAMWQSMGEPSKINLVEFGPGRGTLMQDMFRVRTCRTRTHKVS